MPIYTDEYIEVIYRLKPILDSLPGKIIAIDGTPGAGKTTPGPFLAWYFSISLIESDLFRSTSEGRKELNYLEEEIKRIIQSKLLLPRPVILVDRAKASK